MTHTIAVLSASLLQALFAWTSGGAQNAMQHPHTASASSVAGIRFQTKCRRECIRAVVIWGIHTELSRLPDGKMHAHVLHVAALLEHGRHSDIIDPESD